MQHSSLASSPTSHHFSISSVVINHTEIPMDTAKAAQTRVRAGTVGCVRSRSGRLAAATSVSKHQNILCTCRATHKPTVPLHTTCQLGGLTRVRRGRRALYNCQALAGVGTAPWLKCKGNNSAMLTRSAAAASRKLALRHWHL